ncbi:UPF0598 protein CG30010 isoform X1 [Microplitis mediator]|uniref:UPF0598 protein CG30010 isoform X1 n=1 Tax=Microplitis mediator TaxID=375433 RepID=UPI0025535D2E|nr:UPF0598 protein CG30010 isoform X1 [Microplitis mediator]XP_057328068.1 UPF0598 protein CG30010 isoform X1 [Microplitis mediator]XP_057328069.1 UPF0598 protein CG30010 isoform X1 [Microplitis mediator]XP_057328070.1 UPF0598 protein CG30010 isoform X1 [Microplitis mediator]XP_057328071.1 UPF0598 protein CG30010 isoform X1 [Microplitis mediator]
MMNVLRYSRFNIISGTKSFANYVQGQSPAPNIREYFYFINHQGMLFLDDARIKNFTSCFKEKKFLTFFFKRLKINDSNRYANEFPYLSLCGREKNYVSCDDLPIVFTHVIKNKNDDYFLSYGYAEDSLVVPFHPHKIFMNIKTGRVYHPGPLTANGIGLLKSKLAIEFSSRFKFENGENQGPTHFNWEGTEYILDNQWYQDKLHLLKNEIND